MEDENYEVIYLGYYDDKNHKFMLNSTSKVSFEDLYKIKYSNQVKIDKNKNELINEKDNLNIKYLFNNPHKIKFSFPDDEKKEIYISNMRQLLFINDKINEKNNYEITISDDGIEYYITNDFNKIYASKFIKYTISLINFEDYKKSCSYIGDNKSLGLKDLSLNYEYYLANTQFVNNDKNFFSMTEQRKEFFEFLNNQLSENQNLSLCGLEGIGKTASILAYLKYTNKTYFYYNIKTINKLLENNEIEKIKEILMKEMFHFIVFQSAKFYYDCLDEFLNEKKSSIDLFKSIFKLIKDKTEIIVLDQYKTKYDKDYFKLGSILNTKYKSKLIIMSSINEDDIRESILSSIKWALKINNKKPKLDYYYIISLVHVNEEDIILLEEGQKKLLNEFGNLYYYYYKIKEKASKLKYNLSFSFKEEIMKEMDIKIRECYYNSENKELFQIFITLILNDEKEHKLKDCLNLMSKIPLRYFIFKCENKNIIHFSELKEDDKISFNSAFIFVREYFLKYYQSIFVNKENKNLNKNNEKNQDSIDLEKYFGYFLWAYRNVVKLNNTNIVTYETVNSIIDMKDEFINSLGAKIKKLENGESLLIFQKDQNAKMFDIGIFEKKKEKYNLYLIQVTSKKNSDERITLTGLNDNVNYLNGYFYSKFKINFGNNYFCYIFNYNEPDNATIEYCQKNGIDYFCFDLQNIILYGDLILNPLKYYLPALKTDQFSKNDRMINIEKIKFSECKTEFDENLNITKLFLNKKREIMSKKDINIKEIEELNIYENKIKGSKKTNYERKEYIIDNYLLSTEFKNKIIFGISYKKKTKSKIFFSNEEKKNLFDLCEKSIKKSKIFQVDKLTISNFSNVKPEFGIYIIFILKNNKKYLFDYIKKIYYDLNDKSSDTFLGKKLIWEGDFYSIMFIDNDIQF